MNADFNTLKEQRFNWLSHHPEFSTSRIMRTLSKMPKKSENQKKIKDNGSNLPLWLFVGVDEVRVHTSKQVEANSKLWSHVKWESSFFLLCLLKRRNTRLFGDHLGYHIPKCLWKILEYLLSCSTQSNRLGTSTMCWLKYAKTPDLDNNGILSEWKATHVPELIYLEWEEH